jgi:MFS family permease
MTAPAPAPGGDAEAYPFWRQNKYALAGATFLLAVGFGIANPFLPLMLGELGIATHVETWVGYLQGAYFLLSFCLTPIWGVVADHFGRKAMVLRTSLGMAVLTVLMPVAPNLAVFGTLFVMMGTTNGFTPASQALVATTTPARRLGGSLAWVQTGSLLGGALGPALGAVFAGLVPRYRHLLFVNAFFVVGAGLLALIFAREGHVRPAERIRFDLLGDLNTILAIPNLLVLYLTLFAYSLTYYGSGAIMTVFILELMPGAAAGALNFWVGAVAVVFTVGSALLVPAWGHAMSRLSPARLLTVCLLAGGVAGLPVALVQSPPQLAVARFVTGVCTVGIGPCALALIKARAPKGMEGRVLAYSAGFSALGMGAGPFIAGQIGPWLGLRAYFLFNSLLLLGLMAAWIRSGARAPVET